MLFRSGARTEPDDADSGTVRISVTIPYDADTGYTLVGFTSPPLTQDDGPRDSTSEIPTFTIE